MDRLKLHHKDSNEYKPLEKVDDALGEEQTNGKQEGQKVKKKGLTLLTGSIYILGELTGIGVLAMPKAVVDMGIIGVPLLAFLCVIATYTAVTLAQCWNIVEERYSLRHHVHDPYPTIGFHTFGKAGRYLVSVTNGVSLVGVSLVLIILGGEILQTLFKDTNINTYICLWMLIFSAVVLPLSWLGTPKDMGSVAVGSGISTLIACILLLVSMGLTILKAPSPPKYNPVYIGPFMMAFGKVTYTYSGHMGLPTIHIDMENRKTFYKTVIVSFSLTSLAYLPVALMGYLVFGNIADDNIITTINNLDHGTPLIIVVQILLMVHLLTATVINLNPVFQESEKFLKIENAFGIKRVAFRSVFVAIAVFIAETIPRFGNILSLVGGSTMTLLVFVLPLIFYEKLVRMKGDWHERSISLHRRVLNYEIIAVAVVAGAAATYSAALATFSPDTWVQPCYVNITASETR
ncbi:uncharacterized protein LOC135498178 [Lineus longissimus]|uniref:uncharacterized protein LOC135498178 n=1 Tax=Lineus longissimus TaxID=88925 RepID=UPI002B4E9B55